MASMFLFEYRVRLAGIINLALAKVTNKDICPYRQLGLSESLEKYRDCWSTLERIFRAERGHEIDLADKINKNLKRFCKIILPSTVYSYLSSFLQ